MAQVGATMLLSVAGGVVIAATGDWRIAAALLGGAVFLAIGMLRPALFLLALLAIRPLLDGRPGSPGELVAVVLIGVCAIVMAGNRHVVRPRATMAFVALLAVSALACLLAMLEFRGIIGLDPLTEFVRLAALFAMYLLATQVVRTPDAMRTALLVVGLSGVLPSVSAIAELLNDPEEIASLGLVRVSGTFVNPVALSSYLALCLLILLSLPRRDLRGWIRWPVVGLMSAALVASYGREGWALLLLAIIVLHWRSNKRLIAGIAVACAALLLLVPGVRDRVLPTQDVVGAESASTFASYSFRLANWRGLLERYGERPLTGWGLESTVIVNPRRPYGSQGNAAGGYQAHNGVVRALVEGGVQLLAAILALFASLIAAMWRIARPPDSPLRPYARMIAAAWVAVLVIAITTDDVLDATALLFALLAVTGAVEGAHRRMTTGTADTGPDADRRLRRRQIAEPATRPSVS